MMILTAPVPTPSWAHEIPPERSYFRGEKDGVWRVFHPNGTVKVKEVFRAGRRVSRIEYDTSGRILKADEFNEDGPQ